MSESLSLVRDWADKLSHLSKVRYVEGSRDHRKQTQGVWPQNQHTLLSDSVPHGLGTGLVMVVVL